MRSFNHLGAACRNSVFMIVTLPVSLLCVVLMYLKLGFRKLLTVTFDVSADLFGSFLWTVCQVAGVGVFIDNAATS